MTYSHRNGETTPPTEYGAYWLQGQIDNAYQTEPPGEIVLYSDRDVWATDQPMVEVWGDNTVYPLAACAGRWWGPIPTPEGA